MHCMLMKWNVDLFWWQCVERRLKLAKVEKFRPLSVLWLSDNTKTALDHRYEISEPLEYHIQIFPSSLDVQPADIELPTGNGKTLSSCQAQLGQATVLAVA